jgi:hypothetical protein
VIALLHNGKGLRRIVLLQMRLPADALLLEPVWDFAGYRREAKAWDGVGGAFWRQHRVHLPRIIDPKFGLAAVFALANGPVLTFDCHIRYCCEWLTFSPSKHIISKAIVSKTP